MVGEDTKKTGEHMQRSRGMYEEPEDTHDSVESQPFKFTV